jgi:hypothetical protein
MATHRIKLIHSQTQGPFDIFYRSSDSLTFTLLLANVTDTELDLGICITLPSNAVEMKIVNKHLNSNVEIYKVVTQ